MAKEEIILELKVEQGGLITDLEKTKKSIIGLKEEQQSLNKAYKEGNITLEEYSSESVRVDQVLKKQTKTYSDLTHQIQGTKSWTDQLKGSFQTLAPGVNSTITGFVGMTKAAVAFIATPIGAVIGVLGLALGAVVGYFKGTQEGQDKFNRLATIGAAIVGKFTDAVIGLGKFIFDNLVKGFENLTNVLRIIIPGFDELTDKVAKFLNLDKAETISTLEEQQRMLELQMITKRDQLKADIEAAKLRAAETKDNEVRAQALADARNKVNELFDAEKKLAELQRDIVKERGDLAENTFEDNKEIEESIARIAQIERDRAAELQGIAKKEASIREEKAKELEAEQERQQALTDFQREQRELELEENEAHLEALREQMITDLQEKDTISQSFVEIEREQQDEVANSGMELDNIVSRQQQANLLKTAELKAKLMKDGLSAEQAELTIHRMIENQKLAASANTLGSISGLVDENTVAYQVTASAEGLINTYLSATAAYKGMVQSIPGPFGIAAGVAAAAASILLGLKNVAQINGVALAGGGKFVTKGPTLLLVGDNPGGKERVEVTPLSGRGTTRTFRGGVAMAGGGSIEGSILASSSTRAIDTQFDLSRISENMPPIFASITELREEGQRIQFKEELTQR